MHRCGACVPRTCVSEAQEGKQPMTTDSKTAWGSRREQCSSCDPQAVSLQPPPRPVPTRQPIGPAHPPQARLRSHSLDLMFWKTQRLVCARAEVGLLCAGNALGPWIPGTVYVWKLAALFLCLILSACPALLSSSASDTSDTLAAGRGWWSFVASKGCFLDLLSSRA